MKNLFFILLFIAIGAKTSEAKSHLDTLVVQTTIYCDHCNECESCHGNLENALIYTKGVRAMSVDEESMTITVIYKARKVSPEEIRKVISYAGYDADGVDANPEAQSNLDACCKKKD
ncbi:heavy-metal-associated domain-containing protein [bacterium]|nr:heavy-metal-associated domain-containing protein [bacterium]